MAKIGVIGAGTWGMALARMLCNNGHEVTVWSALPEEIDHMALTRRQANLPDMAIPEAVRLTKKLEEACEGEILLFAVPSVFVRQTARRVAGLTRPGQIIVDVAKGMEPVTLLPMSKVISSEIPDIPVVALSGPTHAEEVARDLPSAIVAAHEDISLAERVQDIFSNPVLRVYTNTDIKGVELCGSLKNVVALAAGISAGLGFGDNTKAALITRGLAEMERLGVRMDCRAETFAGLAGMGDLIVTATSMHSRNNRCGFLIGQGMTAEEAIKKVGMVVEGINAIPAAVSLADKYDVEMPIVNAVDQIINHGANPRMVVNELMTRDMKMEHQPRQ